MAFVDPTTSAGLALFVLIGIVLIKYGGYQAKLGKGLGFIVAATIFMFLDAATGIGFWALSGLAQAQYALGTIWQIIAWILLLVGAFMIASDVAKAR